MDSLFKKKCDQVNLTLDRITNKTVLDIPTQRFNIPKGFKEFNEMIGLPIHPGTGEETEVFDYQVDYFDAWQNHHKLILNKSRKIGATETALRIIAYNCLIGNYSSHRVMIVAGNKQDVANRFIQRFKSLFMKGFTDLSNNRYEYEDVVVQEDLSLIHI